MARTTPRSAKAWIAILAVLAVLSALLLLATFHLQRSETTTESSIARSPGSPKARPLPARNRECRVRVETEGGLAGDLREAVVEAFDRGGGIDASALDRAPAEGDHPLLRIAITKDGCTWTPVWGRASFRVDYVYAAHRTDIPSPVTFPSDHTVESPPPVEVADDAPVLPLWMRGHVALEHRAWGILSLPSFRKELVAKAAAKVVEDVSEGVRRLEEGN